MGLRINLPQANLLGISGATAQVFDTQATAGTPITQNLNYNSLNVIDAARATGATDTFYDYVVSLPTEVSGERDAVTGDIVVVKATSGAFVQIASSNIEGTTQTIEIQDNRPVRLLYVSAAIGWILT